MMDRLVADRDTLVAVRGVRPGGDDAAESIARAAWSVLAEPGDTVAGALIEALGAVEALTLALGTSVPRTGAAVGSELAARALSEARARWRPRARPGDVRDALCRARDADARLILPGDECWPTAVDDLGPGRPSALWVRGDPELLVRTPRVAIVGARAATGYGEHVAAELAGDLAATGAVIVSGGAYGIDGAAHRAALGVEGATVAFLAGGVDRAYPAGHQRLLQRIADEGALVSEPPCGTAPTKWRFLARNRLIAALGHATVVVEAGWRSGSLNTAGHAATLGRPLGAVPGPVTSATSAGCHRLLREYDAQCVTSSAEVRELWGQSVAAPEDGAHDPDRVRLLDALSTRSRRTVDDLARRSGLATDRVLSLLGLLGLEQVVDVDEAGWRRVPTPAPR
ncbi:DNA-processing protein DprA [Microbacterium algeriense]|jgi:DNA processing protein|uniref:DNA-protecting protein DprA n=1 Tax=Microbacterium algeriense TaxID=2615184 RepID=A0ABQ6V5A5_9MICO|nr:DNA-processing protein DprA [Microbacterium algeriense]KAB1864578.1 DNA-protecting protein DprA [Microbacterium algeriense]